MPRTVRDVVFVDGVRTPFGKAGPKGIYHETRADDLVVKAIRELLRRNPGLEPAKIDEVAIAATTQIGDQGLTIGRTAGILAGLPQTVPGYSIDRMCAGALTAVTTVAGSVAFGAYDVAIAGGVEHMGRHPMGEGVDPNPRFVSEKLVDESALFMGMTAENLHDRYPTITKQRADEYAVRSQEKAAKAYANGKIQADLVPISVRRTNPEGGETGWGLVTADEPMRPGTTIENLTGLKTPFRVHGRVTAGNAAGLNDGATASIIASEDFAREHDLPVKMRLVAYSFAGVEPEVMGYGPIPATEKALAQAGLSIDDIGLFEINEAFAVQVLAFLEHYGIADDDARVNQYGGAIAFGHPLASSGVRLMTQLARQFEEQRHVRYGLTTMCVGFGMGATVIWENPHFEGGQVTTTAELLKQASELFPDEVVTSAHVRHLDLPFGAGRFALITLDNGFDHTKPTTFGPASLANLNTAIDQVEKEAAAGEIVGVGITGKPFIFAVGADLKGVELLKEHEHALAIGKGGHEVFKRLSTLAVPTFAYYNGAAMGGGVEVGLHCSYRTVSAALPAFSLPEVFLGLVPGWGGCTLLPNLIGADKAVSVIIENSLNQNKQLKGVQVYELGIADALFEGADFLEQSLLWTASVLKGEIVVDRPVIDRGEAWDQAVAKGRFIADSKVHGAAPAAYRALDIIAASKNGDLQQGYDAEDTALADLIMGGELRAGIYAFNLVQKRGKRPAGAPDKSLARPVTKVGVVGAGLMASQLALLFLRRLEVPVVLTDIDQERVDKGVGYVHAEIDKLLLKGRINQDKANRLKALVTGVLDKAEGFADADFVIEAVFEEIGVKQQVFAEVEAVAPAHAILATNTSSLSVTEMASKLKNPERVVGFHFFNPVAILPLLEIVRGEQTDDASLATAFAVAKKLKKTAVLVKDAPAFVVNRILTRFMGEIQNVIDEGTPVEVAEKAVEPLGLPMSPLVLLELVGPAIGLHVSETLNRAFPDRFTVSPNLAAVVKAGKRGFYVYDSGKPELDPEVAALLKQGDVVLTEEQVRARVLDAVAQEIGLMLDEGVVAEAQDVDLCLITGAGWPFHLGGITPYLDREGVSERVNGKKFLEPGVASVPA